jgi:hypothetical protein
MISPMPWRRTPSRRGWRPTPRRVTACRSWSAEVAASLRHQTECMRSSHGRRSRTPFEWGSAGVTIVGVVAATTGDRARQQEHARRVLTIDGPGIGPDDDGGPQCVVRLDAREGDKGCRVCPYETRQGVRRPRGRVRRETNAQETSGMTSFARAQRP